MSDEAPIIPVIVSEENSSAHADSSSFLRRFACSVGYIPPLFFVPLWLLEKHEESSFHGKQSLVLTLFAVIVNVLGPTVMFLVPLVGALVVLIANILLFILIVLGMYRGACGIQEELPIFGGFARRFTF
ncbi:DUF4870 domain-containing protein [Patescibacteria group bacterium]|nr:DUF4870 domain-containing protein [Patescibacteria group bacterium]